eukprot:1756173-Heterocapsa_arctica.AAC.1
MDGAISQEHMEGNEEADKLATLGVQMHEVPLRKVQEVQAQDKLVTELLTMMLEIMKGVHDKAPVREKEDRHKTNEGRQRWLHGPKTGIHGPHNLVDREAGGLTSGRCHNYTTTHIGWRRLVRSPCLVKAKASRT